MEDRDDDLVLNTHRNAAGWRVKDGKPANYRQMRVMMDRIVRELKEAGNPSPSNDEVLREYSRRMRANR